VQNTAAVVVPARRHSRRNIARGLARMRGVRKLLLGHESVLVEPFEQLLAVRR
jgi:hypothetical protein